MLLVCNTFVFYSCTLIRKFAAKASFLVLVMRVGSRNGGSALVTLKKRSDEFLLHILEEVTEGSLSILKRKSHY